MKAEIITIGTEIMLGSILNTNVAFLSRRLMELGVETMYHTSVDDDYERLEECLRIAMNRTDIIITTGGMGPTDDDLTKEALAHVTGKQMVQDVVMEDHIKQYFSYSNSYMTDNNLKQAMKPSGSKFIDNPRGTAPGIFMEWHGKKIIMMPGPPREMNPMFEKEVVNLIKDDHIIIVKSLNTSGLGESTLETKLKKLELNHPGFQINTYAGSGSVEIKIIGKGKDEGYLNKTADAIQQSIEQEIGKNVYGYNGVSLEEALIMELKNLGLKISVCESITGGSLSRRITRIPGASEVFDRGLVTYSNDSKIDELFVNENTLNKYGAVSSEVAYEMARGLMEKTNSNLVIATTGYAGPDKDASVKTGQIFICVMTKEYYKIFDRVFSGDRESIQERTTNFALWNSLDILKNKLTSGTH